jgi:hypothetical protein
MAHRRAEGEQGGGCTYDVSATWLAYRVRTSLVDLGEELAQGEAPELRFLLAEPDVRERRRPFSWEGHAANASGRRHSSTGSLIPQDRGTSGWHD